ncbi:threonine aldolase [Paraburkholderia bryophila]|uniref:Threonine aldolase n=1 Tax=Paraburkholderia bryophila TaxID=420952 RepID=A0A7Y9W2Q6_9BURK|nr:threonine aldolase [Paraburkholderia bryophila]
MQHFASDNCAGICPEALDALIAANNSGDEPAYGDDSWTHQVCDRIRELFQTDCEVFYVLNGTAANSLPWLGLFDNDVRLRNARHANAMAELLQTRLHEIPGVSIMFRRESNAVFAQLPANTAKAMRARLEVVLRVHRRGRLPADVRVGRATGNGRAFHRRSARVVRDVSARVPDCRSAENA